MKRSVFVLGLFVFIGVCYGAAPIDVRINVNKQEPDEGTPEAVAVAYMRALKAGDADAVLSMCDDKMKSFHATADGALFSMRIKKASQWDFSKIFEYRKSGDESSYGFSFKYFDGGKNRDTHMSLKVIMVNGMYKVTL